MTNIEKLRLFIEHAPTDVHVTSPVIGRAEMGLRFAPCA